jgi:hypothetical protein
MPGPHSRIPPNSPWERSRNSRRRSADLFPAVTGAALGLAPQQVLAKGISLALPAIDFGRRPIGGCGRTSPAGRLLGFGLALYGLGQGAGSSSTTAVSLASQLDYVNPLILNEL